WRSLSDGSWPAGPVHGTVRQGRHLGTDLQGHRRALVPDPAPPDGRGEMKAAIFDRVGEPLRVDDLPPPEPAESEVSLQVAACGDCGSYLPITEGPLTFGVGQGVVLGHEFAGVVTKAGSSVTGLKPADRVAVAPMRGCGACDPR